MSGRMSMDLPLIGQQPKFGCSTHDGPLAHPIIIPALLQNQDGVQVIMSFGGLTKLEAAAIQIAAGNQSDPFAIVQKARQVLDECKKQEAEEAKKQSA